jgi:hypothetical protein
VRSVAGNEKLMLLELVDRGELELEPGPTKKENADMNEFQTYLKKGFQKFLTCAPASSMLVGLPILSVTSLLISCKFSTITTLHD